VFTQDVIDHITRLGGEFTSYQLEKVSSMTSAYAVRIYELLSQHRSIGHRSLNMAWLREKLGVEPEEYKLTTNFIRKVIEVAVDQINKHSDLIVSYKAVKTGRAITDFAFKIKERNTKPNPKILTDQQLREQLEARGQQRIDENTEEF
jgi:plasmid replication initiation protein